MTDISIIVPAFDASRTIEAAIASVQAQAGVAVEILVVDDASRDDTAAIVAGMAAQDPRIRLLRQARNAGPGAARNAGLAVAQGRWIGLLDADDTYAPQRLHRLLDAASAHGADMAADDLLLIRAPEMVPAGPMFGAAGPSRPLILDTAAFVRGNIALPGRTRLAYGFLKPIVARSLVQRAGLRYTALRFSEDYLLALDGLLAGARYVVTSDPLYRYTVARSGLTVSHGAQDLVALVQEERARLDHPAVHRSPPIAAAMRDHIRAVELALGWFQFAEALKRRDPIGAMKQAFRSPAHLRHIGREGVRAVPRALSRIAGAAR